MPTSLLWPVSSTWDEVGGALLIAVLFTALGAGAIALTARRTALPDNARVTAIVAMTIALAAPATIFASSTASNDVVVMGLLALALWRYQDPGRSTALLIAACLVKIAPLILVPIWLARWRGSNLRRAIGCGVGLTALVAAGMLALGGTGVFGEFAHALGFQTERSSLWSPWTYFNLGAAKTIVQGSTLALAFYLTLRARDLDARGSLTWLSGASLALLSALQLSANYWTPVYLIWLTPFAIALIAAPGPQVMSVTSRQNWS
jgi:hypothetical protein